MHGQWPCEPMGPNAIFHSARAAPRAEARYLGARYIAFDGQADVSADAPFTDHEHIFLQFLMAGKAIP